MGRASGKITEKHIIKNGEKGNMVQKITFKAKTANGKTRFVPNREIDLGIQLLGLTDETHPSAPLPRFHGLCL